MSSAASATPADTEAASTTLTVNAWVPAGACTPDRASDAVAPAATELVPPDDVDSADPPAPSQVTDSFTAVSDDPPGFFTVAVTETKSPGCAGWDGDDAPHCPPGLVPS